MTDKATEAHNRMQAEKAHAVNSMKAMARRHKVRCEESAAVERYQRARIAALEIEVEELTRERDEARRWLCEVLARPHILTGLDVPGHGTKHDFAKEHGWDCFKEKA